MATEEPCPNRILRLREVLARVGVSRSTLYALMAEGKFPSSVKLTAGAVGWHSHSVDGWVADREKSY